MITFNLKVWVRVKFRAFLITFGTFEKGVDVKYNGQGFEFKQFDEEPAGGQVAFDQRGVRLVVSK